MIPRIIPNIIPVRYDIEIEPYGNRFRGSCSIYFEDTIGDTIVLHAKDLQIESVRLPGSQLLEVIQIFDVEQISFRFDTVPESGCLCIIYTGIIYDSGDGLLQLDNCIYTQLEPSGARKVFPCVDEPSYKAVFNVAVKSDKKLVLSNMPAAERNSFQQTPLMSTYLLAIYISDPKEFITHTTGNIVVSVYNAHPDIQQEVLDLATNCLQTMTILTSIPYALPKLDLVFVPALGGLAMENWGLITMTMPDERSVIAFGDTELDITISHEICHQWFGNLVTMEWWSDIWLNESLASWASWHILDKCADRDLAEEFYTRLVVPTLDADANTHVVSICHADFSDPADFFNEFTYDKGASIMQMFSIEIGVDVLWQRLGVYLRKFSYKSATTLDLLRCLADDEISAKLMNKWFCQKGYPILHLDDKLKLTQSRFTLQPTTDSALASACWPIPTNISIFNRNGIGFYVVHFPESILEVLCRSNLSNLDRAQLLTDLFLLFKARYIDIAYYLKFLRLILIDAEANAKVILEVLRRQSTWFLYVIPEMIQIIRPAIAFYISQDDIGPISSKPLDLSEWTVLLQHPGTNNKLALLGNIGRDPTLNVHLWHFLRDNWEAIEKLYGIWPFGIRYILESMSFIVDRSDTRIDMIQFFRNKTVSDYTMRLVLDRITTNTEISRYVLQFKYEYM